MGGGGLRLAVTPNEDMTLQIHMLGDGSEKYADVPAILKARAADPSGRRVHFVRRKAAERDPGLHIAGAAASAATALYRSGVRRNDRVLVALTRPIDTWIGYLGCLALGAIPLISPVRPSLDDPATSQRRTRALLDMLGDGSFVLTTGRTSPAVPTGARVVRFEDDAPAALDEPWLFPKVVPEDIAHLQLTSGSTGAPRLIAVTHRNLSSNVSAIVDALQITPSDVFVSWLPLHHDLGLIGTCLASLYGNAELHLISAFDYLRDPLLWLRTISDRRGTITCVPDFALRQIARRCSPEATADLDLRSLRRLVCGGEPVSADSIRAFSDALARCGFDWTAITPSYGLAEATVYVTTRPSRDGALRVLVPKADLVDRARPVRVLSSAPVVGSEPPTDEAITEIVAVGGLNGVPFWVVDDVGSPVEECTPGEIVVAGPSVTAGCVDDPGGAPTPFDRDLLRTGDIGFVHAGELFVVDRLKNLIIRNGRKYSAFPIEHALSVGLSLDVGAVVVTEADPLVPNGPIIAFIEMARPEDHLALAYRASEALKGLPCGVDELVVVPPRSLPKTTSGKKQAHSTRQLYREGGFADCPHVRLRSAASPDTDPAVAPAELIDIDAIERRQRVLGLVKAVAKRADYTKPITVDDHLADDLGIDSLGVFELAIGVEHEFNVALCDDVLADLRFVGDLLRVVDALSRDRAGPNSGSASPRLRLTDRLFDAGPGTGLVADAQKQRQILVNGRWITDFASCNYLGFDLEPEIAAAIAPMVERWGTHPSWTRAVASPEPYRRLESELAELVGAVDTVVFPTVTLVHMGVLPRLAGVGGAILLDSSAHHSIQEAAALARAHGATVLTWRHGDLEELERCLRSTASNGTRVIAVDGVYSMSGAIVELEAIAALAESHDALLYVDDAHGFGVIGSRPTQRMPYGYGGSGVVRHAGLGYDRLIYVAGLSKAYSSLAAFVTCNGRYGRRFFEQASTMVFSGPIPVASLATALAGLDLNRERGDDIRRRLWQLTQRLVEGLTQAGFALHNHSGLPIVNVELGKPAGVRRAMDVLWEAGVIVTPSVFPAMPMDRGGVRFTPTAANTEAEIDLALEAMRTIRNQLPDASFAAASAGRELSWRQSER